MHTNDMIVAASIGAALMYLLDPDRGKARRARLRDRGLHSLRGGWRASVHAARGAANHGQGLISEIRAKMWTERPSDDLLVERVRSEMGHVIRHPRRLAVTADAGWVSLRGDILPDEKGALIDAIKDIPGVFGIDDHLQEHGWMDARLVSSEQR